MLLDQKILFAWERHNLPLKNKETLLKRKKRLLVKGNLENIPVYGIPHPSGSYTSYVDLEKISSLFDKNL